MCKSRASGVKRHEMLCVLGGRGSLAKTTTGWEKESLMTKGRLVAPDFVLSLLVW